MFKQLRNCTISMVVMVLAGKNKTMKFVCICSKNIHFSIISIFSTWHTGWSFNSIYVDCRAEHFFFTLKSITIDNNNLTNITNFHGISSTTRSRDFSMNFLSALVSNSIERHWNVIRPKIQSSSSVCFYYL